MKFRKSFGILVIVAMTMVMAACSGDIGVGIGVSYPATYWGGGTTGPGVFVGGAGGVGGPVYR